MKTPTGLCLILSFLLLLASGNLFALAPDVAVSESKIKFYQGAYIEVLGLLAQSAAENKNTDSKSILSDAYTLFAMEEYSIKNYKNAYECFKEALKLTPTNQAATQGYLKLKREQDFNNLRNLGNRLPPVVIAEVTDPVFTGIENIAEARLTTAEYTVNSIKSESDYLKKQLEDQGLLMEKMNTAQSTAPNNEISAQDSQPASPQVIVQPDPALLVLLGLLFVGILLFVFMAFRRNRRVVFTQERLQMLSSAPTASFQNERVIPVHLDFVDRSSKNPRGKDLSLRSALIKADRLKKCTKRFAMEP